MYTRLKWDWAGHVARLQDNRWTYRVTFKQPNKKRRGGQGRTKKELVRRLQQTTRKLSLPQNSMGPIGVEQAEGVLCPKQGLMR